MQQWSKGFKVIKTALTHFIPSIPLAAYMVSIGFISACGYR